MNMFMPITGPLHPIYVTICYNAWQSAWQNLMILPPGVEDVSISSKGLKMCPSADWLQNLRMTSLLGRLERESAGSAKLSQFGRSLRSPIDVEVGPFDNMLTKR